MIGKLCAAAWLAFAAPVTATEVVALGDSLTAGYGLPPADGFVPQLQKWLAAKGATATVVNAGVSGDTTAGGLARVDWALSPGADALIVALGGNDLLRGLPPDVAEKNLDAILAKAEAKGLPVLLIGLTAPGNYGADYKARFDGMWARLAAKHGALLLPDFVAPILAVDQQTRLREGLVQSDNLHPTAKGVALMVDHVGPSVLALLQRVKG